MQVLSSYNQFKQSIASGPLTKHLVNPDNVKERSLFFLNRLKPKDLSIRHPLRGVSGRLEQEKESLTLVLFDHLGELGFKRIQDKKDIVLKEGFVVEPL